MYEVTPSYKLRDSRKLGIREESDGEFWPKYRNTKQLIDTGAPRFEA